MSTDDQEVLNELRRAAERRQQIAEAYDRKAGKLRQEATEMRRTVRQIARRTARVGPASGQET